MADSNDLAERVDKLSEVVAILSERMARVEAEQRAMRSSIDQLTGEVRQLERRLHDFSVYVDKRLDDFDKRLGDMGTQFDKRLNNMSAQFDKRLNEMSAQFDKRLTEISTQFDKRLTDMSHQFDRRLEALEKRISDIRWTISIGMGIIVLLMTLYRFVHFGATL